MAKDAKLELSELLPSDERVVFETHPHPFRQLLRFLAASIIWVMVIVGILVFVVALGRPILSDVPIISTALNAIYDFAFGDEISAYGALSFYLFWIAFWTWDAFSMNHDRVVYFVTNKRIIWWSNRIGKIVDSIPLASVKMIDTDLNPGVRRRRYANIVFWSHIKKPTSPGAEVWWTIRDPESVLRRLQAMTPEPDPLFVRRQHRIGFGLSVTIGLVLISMAVYVWTEMVVNGEPGISVWLKLISEYMICIGLVLIYQGIGKLRWARRVTVSIRKRQRGKKQKGF